MDSKGTCNISKGNFSSYILNAPKQKFKKPTISPTPFSLNSSYLDGENDTLENSINSLEEKHRNVSIISKN